MWKEDVSLLLANNHPEAHYYPLGYMTDQAYIINKRINLRIASEAIVLHAAMSSMMSAKGGELFTSHIKRLTKA